MTKIQLAELLKKIVKASLDEDVASSIVGVMDFDEMAGAFLTGYWKTDLDAIPEDCGVFLAGATFSDTQAAALVVRGGATPTALVDAETGKPIENATHFATLLALP